jgi:hypothetical protein
MTRSGLPPAAVAYLERTAADTGSCPERVRITQTGQMFRAPGATGLAFHARQELATREVAFIWRARFPVARVAWLDVIDRLEDGEGAMDVRLLGVLRLRRSGGRNVSKGQVMRYLAELPWVPHAIERNPSLAWRELDEHAVEVATRVGSERVAVRIDFDAAGDVARITAPDRPRGVGGDSVETPWGGTFADYTTLGGIRVPTRAEVFWELPDGVFTYWRGNVTSLEAL